MTGRLRERSQSAPPPARRPDRRGGRHALKKAAKPWGSRTSRKAPSTTPTRFEVAVSMAPALAVELRNTLDRLIQQWHAQQAAAAPPKLAAATARSPGAADTYPRANTPTGRCCRHHMRTCGKQIMQTGLQTPTSKNKLSDGAPERMKLRTFMSLLCLTNSCMGAREPNLRPARA